MNIKGNPRIGIDAGTHGDEFLVIKILKKFITDNSNKLPDYLFIPEISPSAVQKHSRKNEDGVDINRVFRSNSPYKEVQNIQSILSNYRDLIYFSFHIDTAAKELYLYDTDKMNPNELKIFREIMRTYGIPLFSGLDDPTLGCMVEDGYVSFIDYPQKLDDSVVGWAKKQGIIKRAVIVEIPGLVSPKCMETMTGDVLWALLKVLGF